MDISKRLEILKAAINRFFYDGSNVWDIQSVKGVLTADQPEAIDPRDPAIVNELKAWEAKGIIQFIGRDDSYFKVLKKFEREPGFPRAL